MSQTPDSSFHDKKTSNDMEVRDSGAIHGADVRPWDKPLSKILVRDFQELHEMVETAPLIARMRDGELSDYLEYLVNISGDLSVLEQHLAERQDDPRLRRLHLGPLYRARALKRDIMSTKLSRPELPPCVQYHRAYFDVLAHHSPYLLVAHAAIWHLGFLFGGQRLGQRMKERWGDRASYHLFEFRIPPKVLIRKVMDELDDFHDNLSDQERARFYNELITAWEFAGDLLGVNIRTLSIRHRPTLSPIRVAHA